MSLGCGDNAAALAELTASAAAQKIDFIVNETMFVERPLSITRQTSLPYILLTRIIYLNGRRLHLVRGMWRNVVRQGVQGVGDLPSPLTKPDLRPRVDVARI
jgi:hypothetical protein